MYMDGSRPYNRETWEYPHIVNGGIAGMGPGSDIHAIMRAKGDFTHAWNPTEDLNLAREAELACVGKVGATEYMARLSQVLFSPTPVTADVASVFEMIMATPIDRCAAICLALGGNWEEIVNG